MEHLRAILPSLETLPAVEALFTGTSIGISSYAGANLPVCIPDETRFKHLHIIGRPGKGKSSTMEYMILSDTCNGHGVAVLDPHGRLVQRLLCLIPPEHADRVIYIDPSDPNWVRTRYCRLFAPVSPGNNWHQNVQALLDLEYSIKLIGGITAPVRYAQQAPSGDLRQMSMDVETKAHNDKPFFAVAFRIGVVDGQEQAGNLIRSLTVMEGLFQHGGRPLSRGCRW